jgi:hypothetical protein
MMTPPPNDLPRELLAAYVDGELEGEARARVERWLADHPDARADREAQRALSPANAGLWERAEPPEPSQVQWRARFRAIEKQLAAPSSRPRWRAGLLALAGLATAGVAAAVAWVAFGPATPTVPAPQSKPQELARSPARAPLPREAALQSEDPLADTAVLAMANDDDVILERVPEFPAGWLPVGRHPLQGAMSLATTEELLLAEVGPSTVWPTGAPKMTTAPGDAPMIFAPKTR